MRTAWSIDRRTTIGMILGVMLLLAVGWTSFEATKAFREDAAWVGRVHVSLRVLEQLRSLVVQPESEVRGFVITGDRSFLVVQPHVRDSARITLHLLDSLVRAYPIQEDLLNSLRPIMAARYDRFDSTIAIRDREGMNAALRFVSTGGGQILSSQIISSLDRFEEVERRLLHERNVATERRADDTVLSIRLGTIISIILFLSIFYLLNREFGRRKTAEHAALEGEARLRSFLDLVPVGIYILDRNGKPYFANRASIEILGKGIEAATSADDLSTPYNAVRAGSDEPYPSAEIPVVRALRGERITVDDLEIIRNGQRTPLLVSGAPVYDESGKLAYALAAFLDITDQRRVQAVIAENERRFREIVEGVSDIIYRTDPNGRFTFVNPVGLRTFGYSEQEVVLLRYVDLIRPDAREKVQRFYIRQAASRVETTYLEIPVVTKNGSEIVLGQNVTLRFEDKQIVGFQAVARDITEERHAQEALARRERQLDTVVSTVDEGITYSDEHGFFEIFNRKMEELTGYTMEEANYTTDFSTLLYPDPADHQDGLDRLQRVLDEGSIRNVESVIRTKTGERRTLLVSTTLVQQLHRRMFLSVYRDITGQKHQEERLREAMEAATAAARARAEFLAVMSHEIRTPMNGVIGMTDVLQHTPLTAEQSEYVDTIRTSGETLLTIINDILDFSKIESGRLELEQRPFDLVTSIEDVYDLLSFKAREKNLDLLMIVDPAVPRMIVGDVTRVRQILLNLVGNAVKFTHAGQVLTRVERGEGGDDSFVLRISVEDTGIGIPLEAQERIFEPFTQVDSSTTRRFGGTGLGLVISRRLVELMQGSISVTSALGKGSTFAFTMRTSIPTGAVASATLYLRSRLDAVRSKRILLVDDNTTNLDILRFQTTKWGMLPTVAALPAEALALLREGTRFDAAILDMNMPSMDGITLAREIRKLRSPSELPLVLLSSRGQGSTLPDEVQELFSTVIPKPTRELVLLEHITAAVAGRPVTERSDRRRPVRQVNLAVTLPLRIMVAEDNDVNQKLIGRLLDKLGYSARIVSNGLEAVNEALASPYDIILMDVNMPEMDGLEATQKILTDLPKESQPLILALTAGVMQEDKDRCAEAGMVDFLSKPLHMEELQSALERWGRVRLKHQGAGAAPTMSEEPKMAERLRQLVEDTDQSFIRELVQDFIVHTRERIRQLETQMAAEQWQDVRYTAHALKGGALNVGAEVLAAVCARIQAAIDDKNWSAMPRLAEELKEQWPRSVESMEIAVRTILAAPQS